MAEIKKINFQPNFFNSIISDASLYYQTKKKMFETVEEFHKILKKGGVIRVYTKSIYDNYYLITTEKIYLNI